MLPWIGTGQVKKRSFRWMGWVGSLEQW